MKKHIADKDVAIRYISKFREHGIAITDGGSAMQVIKHCPWCGSILPESLRDEWFNIVFDKLKLDGLDDPNLPNEMKTDEWWLTRKTKSTE